MNIFEQYGIKEVADVTLYSIHRKQDGSGDLYYVPALYLDTLKVSTTEQTGESTWAQGGQGNARLVNWDYNKTLNISLQDALCSPASLGLCWGGILSADWKNNHLEFNSEARIDENPVRRISRFEDTTYPRSSNNPNDNLVCKLLPQSSNNRKETENNDYLITSDVVDGTRIQGVGSTLDRSYRWRLIIESRVRSVAQVPDRFYDILGRSYPIDWNSKVSVFNGEAPTYSDFKDAIIYKIGKPNERNRFKPFIIFDAFTQDEEEASAEAASLSNYLTYKSNLSPTENSAPLTKVNEKDNKTWTVPKINNTDTLSIREAEFLAIVVDDNDNYEAYVGKRKDSGDVTSTTAVTWHIPKEGVNVNQFKGLDMWLKFESINEMIYFILTKYEQDIVSIQTSYRKSPKTEPVIYYDITIPGRSPASAKSKKKPNISENNNIYTITYVPIGATEPVTYDNLSSEPTFKSYPAVNEESTEMDIYGEDSEERQNDGKLWCYINPRTMKPYLDDYWFHQNEPYYIKSLTLVDGDKQLDAKKITVRSDVWPGVYMMVGETYIRNRDTGEDEHLQLVIPQAKVKSEQTLTLQPDGDPTVFNMNLEVAQPKSKVLMEINTYKTKLKMHREKNGCFTAIDGSSEVVIM